MITLVTLIEILSFIIVVFFFAYCSYTNPNNKSSITLTNNSSNETTEILSDDDISALYDALYDSYVNLSNNYNKIIYLILIAILFILPIYHTYIYRDRNNELILSYVLIDFIYKYHDYFSFVIYI